MQLIGIVLNIWTYFIWYCEVTYELILHRNVRVYLFGTALELPSTAQSACRSRVLFFLCNWYSWEVWSWTIFSMLCLMQRYVSTFSMNMFVSYLLLCAWLEYRNHLNRRWYSMSRRCIYSRGVYFRVALLTKFD